VLFCGPIFFTEEKKENKGVEEFFLLNKNQNEKIRER
jgi:hypothetical protein